MHPFTVIILNKIDPNNVLRSALYLEPQQILVGTLSPLKLDSKIAAIIELKNTNNYSEALNELQEIAQTDWILYLKDNETIIQFDEYMPNLFVNTKEIYGFQVLQDDVILKEPRLWNKKINKVIFKNPVFEKPNVEPTKIIDAILYQNKTNDPTAIRRLETWKRTMPLSIDASYYKAFAALADRNFTEFKRIIAHYLFNLTKSDIPSVMARYYLALVQGVVENNTKEAIKNVVICLAENPLMAEFWCLLGDIFVKTENFSDAIEFYENAIILGARRLNLDFWPMHISKYETYPKEMIEKCKKVASSAETYRSNV
jgi:tetratricopeptide (TPR) repeat protein